MRMRTLTIVIAAAGLALAGCKKKNNDAAPSAGSAGSGAGTAAGSAGSGAGTAGSGAGTAMAGSGAGTDMAGSAGSGAGSAAGDMANKAGNCPVAVADAVGAIVEDKDHANAVVLTIVAKTQAGTETVRKRTSHLVEVQGAPDAEVKHSGEGTGGGEGMCPVVTSKDVKIESSEIENGVKIIMTPSGAVTVADLAKDVADRLAKMGTWRDFKPTDHSGGGGGQGGGKGDHGGNHSGDGDGHGKDKKKPDAPAGEPAVPTGSGAGSQS